jgi:hypothetical protein
MFVWLRIRLLAICAHLHNLLVFKQFWYNTLHILDGGAAMHTTALIRTTPVSCTVCNTNYHHSSFLCNTIRLIAFAQTNHAIHSENLNAVSVKTA